MRLLCKLFGHQARNEGWWGDGLYGRVTGGRKDGIGRVHYEVWKSCVRCGEDHIIARFHGSQVKP